MTVYQKMKDNRRVGEDRREQEIGRRDYDLRNWIDWTQPETTFKDEGVIDRRKRGTIDRRILHNR